MTTAREIVLEQEISTLKSEVVSLRNQLEAVLKLWKGKKTEKLPGDPDQPTLFELQTSTNKPEQPVTEDISYARKKRKEKPVRSQLPENLRREVIEIHPEDVPAGSKLIGKEITETLEVVQAEVYVKQYVRFKYGLPNDEGVVIAPLPKLPIYKGMAGASMLAHLMIAKYQDHLPYYRQVQIFNRLGINLSRSTINGWFKTCVELLKPLYDLMQQNILVLGYLMADESTVKVQDKNKKGSTFIGYHWVYYSPLDKTVVFVYQPGRKGIYPKQFLKDFNGALQTDGYSSYNYFDKCSRITLLGCMAHARRKFWDAKDNNGQLANQALDYFKQLYYLEKQAREQNMTHNQRYELRQKEAKPILKQLKLWLDKNQHVDTPKSKIQKAINYCHNQWHRLERYIEDGKYEIDNNLVENSIRPLALGRKNYLFCGNHEAAQNSAIIYSLLGTCKKNNVNPNQWLPYVLEKLPYCQSTEDYEKLLPQNFTKAIAE